MGTNRRYGSDLRWESIAEAALRAVPVSLSSAEIGEPVTTAQPPVAIEAWLRFVTPETPILVQGRAIAWTKRAVHIEVTMRDGRVLTAWVPASGVSSIPKR
jgi:hypothetical protein